MATKQQQLQAARLAKSVWLTLETLIRADNDRAPGLEQRLNAAGKQVMSVASMNVPWMKLGDWDERENWTNAEWISYLRMYQHHGSFVFGDDFTTSAEKKLFKSFLQYLAFYSSLPNRPKGVQDGVTMDTVVRSIDEQLESLNPFEVDTTGKSPTGISGFVIIICLLVLAIAILRKYQRGES